MNDATFDEVVIAQDAQVVPAFIVQLNTNSKLADFYKEYKRDLS